MISWPRTLVRELAARRCVLFIGSGVSAGSLNDKGLNVKTWSEFITEACGLVGDSHKKQEIEDLLKLQNYLVALEGIKKYSNNADFRELLNSNFNDPSFNPNELHRIIMDLDSRVVVSTNFDKLYENHCASTTATNGAGAFKVIQYSSTDLCDELKSDTRLIIKAHGSIDEVNRMIFTRSEYHTARAQNHGFYEILKALFMTNTVVFIGCGMQDPDMLLVLEEVNIVGESANPHYVITHETSTCSVVIDDWKKYLQFNSYYVRPKSCGPCYGLGRIARTSITGTDKHWHSITF